MDELNIESTMEDRICMSLSTSPQQTIKITLDIPERVFDYLRATANEMNLDRSKVLRPAIILGLAQLRALPGLVKHTDADLLRE